jgi:hypothetical protein
MPLFHRKAAYLPPLLGVTRCRAGIAFDQGTARAICHFDRRGFYFMDTCNDKLRLSKGSLFLFVFAEAVVSGGCGYDVDRRIGSGRQ